jgi:hypothetical protein
MAGKGHHHPGHHHHHHAPPKMGKVTSTVGGGGGALGRLSLVMTPTDLTEDDEDEPKDERMSKLLDVHTKLNGIGALRTPSKTMLGGSRASMASMASLSNVGEESSAKPKMSAMERLAATRASRASHAGGAQAMAAKKGMSHDPVRDEMIIQTLASLFVAAPSKITAFAQLVPKVFESHLKLDVDAEIRLQLMALLESVVGGAGAAALMRPFAGRLLSDVIAPNIVWKAGGVASTIRKVSIACLFTVLKMGAAEAKVLFMAAPKLLPVRPPPASEAGAKRQRLVESGACASGSSAPTTDANGREEPASAATSSFSCARFARPR